MGAPKNGGMRLLFDRRLMLLYREIDHLMTRPVGRL